MAYFLRKTEVHINMIFVHKKALAIQQQFYATFWVILVCSSQTYVV